MQSPIYAKRMKTEHCSLTPSWWVDEPDFGKMSGQPSHKRFSQSPDFYHMGIQPNIVKQAQPYDSYGDLSKVKSEDPFKRPITPPSYATTHSTPVPVAMGAAVSQRAKYDEWLKVEVCREFQRDKCNRKPIECKYAHPKHNVNIENGKVTACYDFLKGKCHRGDSCRFIHPENPNIKAQLEMNGRNAQFQRKMTNRMVMNPSYTTDYMVTQPVQPAPTVVPTLMFLQNEPASRPMRADRLEICRDFLRSTCTRNDLLKEGRTPEKLSGTLCKYAHPERIKDTEFGGDRSMIDETDNTVIVCMDFVKGKCHRDNKCKYYHPEAHLINEIKHRQSLLSSHLHAQNNNAMTFKDQPILHAASSPLSQTQTFSVPVQVQPTVKYEPTYATSNSYKHRAFDQRPGASPSPVQPATPTSAPWTASYHSNPSQTSFVPMVFSGGVYQNSFGQQIQQSGYLGQTTLANGFHTQSNGSQQTHQTINPMTMQIGTWSASEPEIRMDHQNHHQNLYIQQNPPHSQAYDYQ